MTKTWVTLRHTTPSGYINNFTLLIDLPESSKGLTPEEMKDAVDKCLELNYKYPVPEGYSIH